MSLENADLGPMAFNAALGAVSAGAAVALTDKPMPRKEVLGFVLAGTVLAATVPDVAVYYGCPKVMSNFIGVIVGLCGGALVPKIQRFVDTWTSKKSDEFGGNKP